MSTLMGVKVLPKAVAGFLPRWYIFFFMSKHTSVDSFQWNEIDMELRKTTLLSIVKSLQILITVRKTKIIAWEVWP